MRWLDGITDLMDISFGYEFEQALGPYRPGTCILDTEHLLKALAVAQFSPQTQRSNHGEFFGLQDRETQHMTI